LAKPKPKYFRRLLNNWHCKSCRPSRKPFSTIHPVTAAGLPAGQCNHFLSHSLRRWPFGSYSRSPAAPASASRQPKLPQLAGRTFLGHVCMTKVLPCVTSGHVTGFPSGNNSGRQSPSCPYFHINHVIGHGGPPPSVSFWLLPWRSQSSLTWTGTANSFSKMRRSGYLFE